MNAPYGDEVSSQTTTSTDSVECLDVRSSMSETTERPSVFARAAAVASNLVPSFYTPSTARPHADFRVMIRVPEDDAGSTDRMKGEGFTADMRGRTEPGEEENEDRMMWDEELLDLVKAIRMYRQQRKDAYYSHVNTVLTSRTIEEPVTGRELREAVGDKALMQLIIENGNLALDDLEVQLELKGCIDDALVPSEDFGDRLNPASFDYIRSLFQVPFVRITKGNHKLLRRSGFEFVKLMDDVPYVKKALPPPHVCSSEYWSLKSQRLEPALMVIGIGIIFFDLACIALMCIHWFMEGETSNGYITIFCYLGCHLLSFIATAVILQTKAEAAVYGEMGTDFPPLYLKSVPVLPLFETFCFAMALKHWVLKKNYVLRHDLGAMFTLSRIVHSMFHSTIQILLQSYFSAWSDSSTGSEFVGFKLLLASSLVSIGTAVPLYIRFVVTFHSVNSLGFAYFGNAMAESKTVSSSAFPRVLAFLLLYLFEINTFFLVVAVLNVQSCSANMIVWISIASVIVVSTLLMFLWTLCTSKNVIRATRWAIPPIFCQLAFTIFFASTNDASENEECRLFFLIGGVNVIVGYVSFGLLMALCAVWGIRYLWRTYRTDKARNDNEAVTEPDSEDY